MKFHHLTTAIAATATLSLLGFTGQSAQAGTFHNGWNYAIDSFNDGYNNGVIGATSKYEFHGLAVKQTADKVSVAINSNMQLGGWNESGVANSTIAYGDLIFNFTDKNLADSQGSLFGIHFDQNGDTGLGLGVYNNVTTKSVASSNSGFSTLSYHAQKVANKGGTATLGDLAENDPYFGDKTDNVINTGNKIGDIAFLSGSELSELDFGHFNATGNYTFGFSFDRNLLPTGDFLAYLFAECANDGLALAGTLDAPPPPPVGTPEPSAMLALALVGGVFALKRRQA